MKRMVKNVMRPKAKLMPGLTVDSGMGLLLIFCSTYKAAREASWIRKRNIKRYRPFVLSFLIRKRLVIDRMIKNVGKR